MRKGKLFIFFLFFSFLVFLFLGWVWTTQPACQTACETKIFVVKKGESLGNIAQRLEEEKLVRSSVVFQILAAKLGMTRKIQAGDFRLNAGMSPEEIVNQLAHGTLDRWVTLIEGWRKEEIAEKLFSELGGEQAKFNQTTFLQLTKNLEGQLFPDTYLFPKEATAGAVLRIILRNFEKKTSGLRLAKESLILASIVEREAKFAVDRPIVAGILLKRLASGWPLQADATVQYAVATKQFSNLAIKQLSDFEWWPKKLTKEDLKLKSPYNTYLYRGLPPTPIANPGLASIKAVLEPQETDYWFYLSDRQGKMHYAQTHEEHQQNIERYLDGSEKERF